MINPASTDDYRELARRALPKQFFDYIDGGSYAEDTLRNNVNAFSQFHLKQRILRDVSTVSTETSLFDDTLSLPLILAPVGLAGCYHTRGEIQAAKAAKHHQIPFCLSTVSICSIEEVTRSANTPPWFQLYVIKDRDVAKSLMSRAKTLGCDTLVLTVDLPVLGERYRDIRNGFSGNVSAIGKLKKAIDFATHPNWVWRVAVKGKPLMFGNLAEAVPSATKLSDFKYWVDSQFDASMTWEDIKWIRDHWQGKLIIKGILSVEDAQHAVDTGTDAIVVSNHGGRQLDSASATISMLPKIKHITGDKCKVLLDSGVRSGIDLLKAKALGADACMIGRPWAYALAANGENGVNHLIDIFKQELRTAMALTGITHLSQAHGDILTG